MVCAIRRPHPGLCTLSRQLLHNCFRARQLLLYLFRCQITQIRMGIGVVAEFVAPLGNLCQPTAIGFSPTAHDEKSSFDVVFVQHVQQLPYQFPGPLHIKSETDEIGPGWPTTDGTGEWLRPRPGSHRHRNSRNVALRRAAGFRRGGRRRRGVRSCGFGCPGRGR